MAKKGELLKNVPVGHAATYFQSAPPSAGSFQRAVAEAPKARGPLRLWKFELGRWGVLPTPAPVAEESQACRAARAGKVARTCQPPAGRGCAERPGETESVTLYFLLLSVLKTLGSRSLGGSKTRSEGFSRLREIQWDGNSAPGGAALPCLVRGRRPFQRGAPRPPRRHRIPASQRKAPGLPIWAR